MADPLSTMISDTTSSILGSIKGLLSLNTRDFSDINKYASKNNLTLYSLVSSDLDTAHYAAVTSGVHVMVVSAIQKIANDVISKTPEEAIEFINRNLRNGAGSTERLVHGRVDSIRDTLQEAYGLDLDKDVEVTLSINEDTVAGSGVGSLDIETRDTQAAIHNRPKLTSISLGAIDSNGKQTEISLAIATVVRLIPVDKDKLFSAMSSAKNRGIFNDYLLWRAKRTQFFRDFVVNLKELQRQVKRDTSDSLDDRILSGLLGHRGLTRPQLISDMVEFNNFTVAISSDDMDVLTRDYGVNLTKPSDLRRVFKSLSILAIYVIDENKNRVTIFESHNPTEMSVVPLPHMNDESRLAQLFLQTRR